MNSIAETLQTRLKDLGFQLKLFHIKKKFNAFVKTVIINSEEAYKIEAT